MEQQQHTDVEELDVAGNELLDRIDALVREGNARRIAIHDEDGQELLSVSLAAGAVAGGLMALSAPILAAPVLAALAALAAVMTRAKLVVTRERQLAAVPVLTGERKEDSA